MVICPGKSVTLSSSVAAPPCWRLRQEQRLAVIGFHQVSKHFADQEVLRDISFQVNPGDKVGLIGANGTGKSTLLHLLTGAQQPSSGMVVADPDLKIGFVPQQLDAAATVQVREYLLGEVASAERALRTAEHTLAGAAEERMAAALRRYQAARDRYDALNGDQAAWQAERALERVGLAGAGAGTVALLSGGERNLLSLARALLRDPGLLVLDEPGNHLDYAGLEWLEEMLASFLGGVLLVSHNRRLLDRTVTRILELTGGRIREYRGNYTDYRLARLQSLVAQRADYTAAQKRIAQLTALVARLAAVAAVHSDKAAGRRLRARRTQLAREESQAVARPVLREERVAVVLPQARSEANVALQVIGYERRFGDRVLFRDARLEISCGERVALVGPNGCGKTTLLRDIVAHGSWEHPVLRVGPSLTVGYCAQNQDTFAADQTILDAFVDLGLGNRQEVLGALRGYLFTWDDLDKRIGALSGGERNRLQIAAAVQRQANFLILDEPTNHMDIPSCEAIEDALLEFTGTVLLVSHDRYLLDSVATAVVEVRGQGLHRFPGGFSEYWAERKPRPPVAAAADGAAGRFRNHRWKPGLNGWRARRWSWSVRSRGRCSQETGPWSGATLVACGAWSGRLERLYEQWAG